MDVQFSYNRYCRGSGETETTETTTGGTRNVTPPRLRPIKTSRYDPNPHKQLLSTFSVTVTYHALLSMLTCGARTFPEPTIAWTEVPKLLFFSLLLFNSKYFIKIKFISRLFLLYLYMVQKVNPNYSIIILKFYFTILFNSKIFK